VGMLGVGGVSVRPASRGGGSWGPEPMAISLAWSGARRPVACRERGGGLACFGKAGWCRVQKDCTASWQAMCMQQQAIDQGTPGRIFSGWKLRNRSGCRI